MNNSLQHKYQTIFIVGPTASGKSLLALELAQKLHAEIVCADSQTLRRYMDIGTAKPSSLEASIVPHHMLNVINPYDDYSVAEFQRTARLALTDIHNRGKIAIVVGGTGLYVDSLYFNFQLPKASRFASCVTYDNWSIEKLQIEITQKSLCMPTNPQNKRHLINVLIRDGVTGKRSVPEPSDIIIGLNPPRELLIDRINKRVELMFQDGLVEEVRGIIDRFGRPTRKIDAIGYFIAMRLIDGEITEPEAKNLLKIAHRQYAKRQLVWFKRNQHIIWKQDINDAKEYVMNMLNIDP